MMPKSSKLVSKCYDARYCELTLCGPLMLVAQNQDLERTTATSSGENGGLQQMSNRCMEQQTLCNALWDLYVI